MLLFAVAALGSWAIGPRGPLYWDSFGYVAQALTNRAGGLALGRPGFVLLSHGVARALSVLGVGPDALEPALRTMWLFVSALGAPGVYLLARRLALGSRVAFYAALVYALSPAAAHTACAVLTDAPASAVCVGALAFALDRRRAARVLFAGGLFGLALALREQSITLAPALVALVFTRDRASRARAWLDATAIVALALAVAAVPVSYYALAQRDYLSSVARWVDAMKLERAAHPYTLRDFGAYLAWLVALSPAGLVAAFGAWACPGVWITAAGSDAGSRLGSPRLALCGLSLTLLAALGFYQDIAFSPRYLVPALAGAIAIPAGVSLAKCSTRVAIAALIVPFVLACVALRIEGAVLRRVLDETPARVHALPPRAALVTGQPCPAAQLALALARHANAPRTLETVCPGWSWPPSLARTLDDARARGLAVYLDLRLGAWVGPRQLAARAEAERYLRANAGRVFVWR